MAEIMRTVKTILLSDMLTNKDSEFNLRTSGLSSNYLDDNVVHAYIDFLFDGAYFVTFSDVEKDIYNADPKRLAKEKYGTTDAFFVIMAMNNFREYEDMDLYTLKGIYIPSEARMTFLINLVKKKLDTGIVLMDYDEEA